MASVAELSKLIGRVGHAEILNLSVPVEVSDIRERFGQVDYLITPLGGSGETWVTEGKVTLEGPTDE